DGPPAQSFSEPPEPEPQPPAIREIMRVASPFVEQLQAAQAEAQGRASAEQELEPEPPPRWEPADEPVAAVPEPVEPAGREIERVAPVAPAATPEPEPEPEPASRTGAAAAHERTLVAAGIAPALAADIIAATVSHAVPFAPGRALKHLVRDALAARIPVAAPVPAGPRAVAFVGAGGAGKTLCATRLAAAYAAASDLGVRLIDLAAEQVPEPAAGDQILTVIDTAAISPASGADARALARRLRRAGPCEVHVAVPATLSAGAARRLLDGLAAVKPAAIVLTHLDEVDHAGPVIDAAIARGLAISYCSDADGLAPVDRAALCAHLLP
ncbi:MAG: hypothetical protein QOE11_364, partial [Solirubrobacteraceae bacterium]|nr:hypothetical protein [Solirubrobacteraceae bacterium]